MNNGESKGVGYIYTHPLKNPNKLVMNGIANSKTLHSVINNYIKR